MNINNILKAVDKKEYQKISNEDVSKLICFYLFLSFCAEEILEKGYLMNAETIDEDIAKYFEDLKNRVKKAKETGIYE